MKRTLSALSIIACGFLFTSDVSAQYPVPGPVTNGSAVGGPIVPDSTVGGCEGCDAAGVGWGGDVNSPYGWNRIFQRWRLKKSGGWSPAPAYRGGYGPPGVGSIQGTLVFPKHPFARSPRDFFMVD